MSLGAGSAVWISASFAALTVDVLFHPLDTLITRMQSPTYTTHYKTRTSSFHRSFFLGLYQGFGPTLIAGIPSSVAFFTVYESSKNFSKEPSAVAELVSCAILNPAEVIKQNAQIQKSKIVPSRRGRVAKRGSPLSQTLRHFVKHPGSLWAGYSTLIASHLPGTVLMFSLYEILMDVWLSKNRSQGEGIGVSYEIGMSALSAAIAGGFTSSIFVPIDVIKTRIRIMASGGSNIEPAREKCSQMRMSALAMVGDIFRKEGVSGLFRGFAPTVIATALGSGLYLGCYEACKLYLQ